MSDGFVLDILAEKNRFASDAERRNPALRRFTDYWRNDEWKLIKVNKKVVCPKISKIIFDYRDMTIGKKPLPSSFPTIKGVTWMVAYSPRIGRNFFIRQNDIEFIEGESNETK